MTHVERKCGAGELHGGCRRKDQPAAHGAEEEAVQAPAGAGPVAAAQGGRRRGGRRVDHTAPPAEARVSRGRARGGVVGVSAGRTRGRPSQAPGPAPGPTSPCPGRSAGSSCSRSGWPRKRRQPWKWKHPQSQPGLVSHSPSDRRR